MNKCMNECTNEGVFVNVSYTTRENCLGKLLTFPLCHILPIQNHTSTTTMKTSAVGAAL
jgi:hypothetical protein